MKIVIAGAGISGLVLAHQLLKEGHEIHIYECNNQIGGLARSSRDSNGCPTEYSWRIYFWFYKNLFSILGEIPLASSTTNGSRHSVLHNLSTKGNSAFMYPKQHHSSDYLTLAWNLFKFGVHSDKSMQQLDSIPWIDYMRAGDSRDRSPYGQENPWETTPQVLGLDKFKASTYSVLKIGMQALILHPLGAHNYAMTKPTSEAWFEPWQQYLERKGVKFHFNHRLMKIHERKDQIIHSFDFLNLKTKNTKTIYADHFVMNVPVQELARLIGTNPLLFRETQLRPMKLLAKKAYILQLCFQVHFLTPIFLADPESTVTGFIVVDSPWSVIIETREALFGDQDSNNSNNPLCLNCPQIKGSWSILAGQDGVPGIVFGKPLSLCSDIEIQIELWAQIISNRDVCEAAYRWNKGLVLNENIFKVWSPMWPSFYYENGRLTTSEPKFSNNSGTLHLRPSCKLKAFQNLHLASAYTREALDIFSMEGAAISGMTVAQNITGNSKLGPIYHYDGPDIFEIPKTIDDWLSGVRI